MWEWLTEWFKEWTEVQIKIAETLVLVVVAWVVRRLLRRSIMALQNDLTARYTWSKTAGYTVNLLTLVGIAVLWSNNLQSLATFLGLLSAGLAVAFKDPIANLAGWYFIVSQKPFRVGDRIEIEGKSGDVVDINAFQFTMMEIGNWARSDYSTGRIIHIPNSKIFSHSLVNYDEGIPYIWNEIPVQLTYESDWKLAKTLLLSLLQATAPRVEEEEFKREIAASGARYLIHYGGIEPTVYTTAGGSGYLLCLRYLCRPKERRTTENRIWERIFEAFYEQPNIHLAYDTRRTMINEKTLPKSTAASQNPPPARHNGLDTSMEQDDEG